tara:strand:+ start:114 stop:1352 length:1239 start_codon:yes stop_codon:yes gene_type:complete
MKIKLLAAFSLMLLHTTGGWAQESQYPKWHFNGYGTLGVVHSSEDQADFVADVFDPDGAGYNSELSPEVDSRLGLQATVEITPDLVTFGQIIFEQRYDGTWKPDLEWANIRYDFSERLSARVGRMVLPTFLTSEFRKVGYALPWIRPPLEVYRQLPVSSADAISVGYRFRTGDFNHHLQALYGRRDLDLPGDDSGEVKARELASLSYTLERGAMTFISSYSTSELTVESFDPLFNGFRQFGPAGEAIAKRYAVENKRSKLFSVGAQYDPGDWFVMGEMTRSTHRSVLGDSYGMYVTGGYRFGAVIPYLTLALVDIDSDTSDPGLPVEDLPPALAGPAGALNAGLNDLLASPPAQTSASLGARWDFAPNFTLKLQFDHLQLDDDSAGLLIDTQPGFEPGGTVMLYSASIDFVF